MTKKERTALAKDVREMEVTGDLGFGNLADICGSDGNKECVVCRNDVLWDNLDMAKADVNYDNPVPTTALLSLCYALLVGGEEPA